jgi:uncharacterized membrane protein YfcA
VTALELSVLLAAVGLAGAAQAVAGFGLSLLSVPLMSLVIDTHDAVLVATVLGIFSSGAQAVLGRDDIDRALARRLLLSAAAGIPFGLLVFTRFDEDVLRLVVGIGVLIAVVLLVIRLTVADHRTVGDVVAGVLSGALAASVSTNGPPLVVIMQAKNLPMRVFRPTINLVFSLSAVMSLVAFLLSREVGASGLVRAAVAAPAIAIGAWWGHRVAPRIPEEAARRIVLSLLTVAGVSAIASALTGIL